MNLICVLVIIRVWGLFELSHGSQEPCALNQFRCLNQQCIAGEFLCDGKQDCLDGSDETQLECLKPEIICPEYAFRCDYGACIDGDAVCNGINDCIDKTDEKLPRCHDSSKNTSVVNSNCGVNQFKCSNEKCIDEALACDGSPDCSDRSDETSTTCSSNECPKFTFRCAYGACIDGDMKCNGIRNCADGSDEDFILCNEEKPLSTSTTEKPIRQTVRTTSQPWTQSQSPCVPPKQPQNGRWKLHKSQCQSNDHCDANGNTAMVPGTYLVYTCNSGYELKGSGDIFCGPKSKWSGEPECVEIRCKPLSSASTIAECTYNDGWISCEAPVPPQTTAKISCRNSYRQDATVLGLQRDSVRCNSRGEWEPEPINCIPVCGVRAPSSLEPLIVNGRRPNITEFPWHASLYKSDSANGEKKFICGSTIIQSDLLITAAHCVYDEVMKRVEDPGKFSIAAGNIFRDFNSLLHDSRVVQKRNVKKILIDCNYLGFEGNYARDIAIIQIDKPFTFTSILVPICLDTSVYDHTAIDVGKLGSVAGFGRTEMGQSSGILQSITLPVVPLSQCQSASVSSDAEKFITVDKFCAGYTNGTSVCDGDSGGGLVFNERGLWYIRGIVSVGIGSKISGGSRTCNSHLYSLYTKISSHISWIQDIIFKLETNKNIPACKVTS
ncbi:modular serine protease [Microplitis demolitor]|uniref:modular serine protease n=1 Tax=Microplitis demolitor TaxID=69319 RepID=UPI0004CCB39E|nr:modular serine protease [Microplitis demolitor]XP_008546104.1 modular serine protease [Microplitis demolitor]XP_008546105.1 modular serine protease [Microplitis demolitor]XP_008546107.1 modular serine protease [Microplitis demolitor]XP_053594015.1 modular serine protease [Microplitis demolitor]